MANPLTKANPGFFDLPGIGKAVEYLDGGGTLGKVTRMNFDTIAIETKLGQKTVRSGYEKQLKLTVPGFDRAHALGKIAGHESPHGIYWTPKDVNRKIQAQGIELFLEGVGKFKKGDLYVTVTVVRETAQVKMGKDKMKLDFLKEVTYTIHTVKGDTRTRIFEAGFSIDKASNIKARVLFTDPKITSAFNKHCNLEKVLEHVRTSRIANAMRGLMARAKVPYGKLKQGLSAKPTAGNTGNPMANNPVTQKTKVQDITKTTVNNKAASASNRLTGIAQQGITRMNNSAKDLASKLSRFFTHTGRYAIKNLSTILKGVVVYSLITSLFSLLNAINTSTSVLAHGTPVPDFEKKLAILISALNAANKEVNAIYNKNIMEENIPAMVDEMLEIGDKENLDKLTEALMKDKDYLFKFRKDLEESLGFLVQLQKDVQKSADTHKKDFSNKFAIESATKGNALLMWDALARIANSLNHYMKETQTSIDTLEALENDYNELVDYSNDAAWTLQILRNRDITGLEVYPNKNVKPLESIWGAEVTHE